MTDIASLGLEINTSQVTSASSELDKLTAAGNRAGESAEKIASKYKVSNGQMNDTAAFIKKATVESTGFTKAQLDMAMAGDKFIIGLQKQADALGLTNAQLLRQQAAMHGVSSEADEYIKKIEAAGNHMDGFSFKTAGAKRELIVLAHELSQGNFSRFGGSMMVLGERTGAASLLFSAAGIAAIGMGAAFVGVAALVVKGALEQKAMNDALIMTGNIAGTTSDGLMDISRAASQMGGTIGVAKEAVIALAASGRFTSSEILKIGEAATLMHAATGAAVKDTIKQFEELAKSPAEAVLKLDDQYHFLTEAIYEQILALEKQGDRVGAAKLAEDQYADAIKNRAGEIEKNLGYIATLWQNIKKVTSEATDSMNEWGKSATDTTKVADAIAKIEEIKKTQKHLGLDDHPELPLAIKYTADLAAARLELTNASQKLIDTEFKVKKQGEETLTQQAAKHAAAYLEQEDTKGRQKSALDLALAKNAQAEADIKAADAIKGTHSAFLTDEAIKERRLHTIKKYSAAAKAGNDDRFQMLNDQLVIEQMAQDREKHIYDEREKMLQTYHSKLGMSDEQFYAAQKSARDEYVAAEADNYEKEKAIIESFNTKNPKEVANNKLKLDKLLQQHLDFNDKMDALRNEDAVNELALNKAVTDQSEAATGNYLATLRKQADALEFNNGARERSKSAIEAETIAMTKLAIANLQESASQPVTSMHTQEDIDAANQFIGMLQQQLGEQTRIYAAYKQHENDVAGSRAAEQAINDWKHAGEEISKTLTDSFGNVGKAIGGMAKAYLEYGSIQLKINKELKDISKGRTDDDPVKIKAIDDAKKKSAEAQIRSYGDMAGAAQGFFKEGSKGYEAMGAVSKAYHAVEMAMTIQSMLTNTTAAATKTATNIASIPPAVAAGGAQMFAQSGWVGFAGVAAMLAAMAALGFSGGGGGVSAPDPNSAEAVQKAQGTGTVFGDASAKSDSIAKSSELLARNSNLMLPLTSQMANSLKNMEYSMAGLANLVLRTDGIKDGSNLGIATGKTSGLNNGAGTLLGLNGSGGAMAGGILGAAVAGPIGAFLGAAIGKVIGNTVGKLWGKSSTEITDSGLMFGGSVSSLQQGQGFNQYANVHSSSSSWFGLKHSSSDDIKTQAANGEISQQFGQIFKNLQDTLVAASSELGKSGGDTTKAIQSFVLDTTKASFKDLKGDDLQKAINAVISGAMDKISQSVFPELSAFRQVGEGYTQTVVRVATGIESAGLELDKFGVKAINYSEILSKQGDVGAEIVRQTLEAIERNKAGVLTGVGQIVSTLQGTATDLASVYQSMLDIRKLMADTKLNGNDLGVSLIKGAGGVSELNSGLKSYLDKYFSPAEQSAAELKDLSAQFTAIGEVLPTTKDGFRAMVSGIDTSTESGSKLAGQLLSLSGAFSDAIDHAGALTAATEKQTAKQTVADATNNLTAAYNRESSALQSTITKFQQFAQSLRDFSNSLSVGALSTLSPEKKYLQDKAEFEKTAALAKTGDATAMGKLQSVATQFLNDSKAYNASTQAYANDYNAVQDAVKQSATAADKQVSEAQAQLTIMNAQVSSLITINASVLSVKDAIMAVNAAKAAASGGTASIGGAGFAQYESTQKTALQSFANQYGENAYINGSKQLGGSDSLYAGKSSLVDSLYSQAQSGALGDLGSYKTLYGNKEALFEQFTGHSEAYWKEVQKQIDSGGHPTTASIVDKWKGTARAIGGYTPSGLTLVGEQGPELVNFNAPSNISTAADTRRMLSSRDNSENTEELKEQTRHLRALVALQSAANQALLEKLGESNDKLDGIQKKANLASVK